MSITNAALNYASAVHKHVKVQEPVKEFERMLKQWSNQRKFRWANVELEMTDEAADLFYNQLWSKVAEAEKAVDTAERILNAYANRSSESN